MKWSNNDINLIISLFNEGKTPNEIAKSLNRTKKSINLKLNRLGYKFKLNNIILINCKYCQKEFQHFRYRKQNKIFCSKSCAAKFNVPIRKIDKNILIESKCVTCNNEITLNHHTPKQHRYCFDCACKLKLKRFKKHYYKKFNIVQKTNSKNIQISKYPSGIRKCITCNSDMNVSGKKLICNSCRINYYKHYRVDCNFIFHLSDYPNEFDFNLIKKHGWYSPSNKKNNLNGVSRDHIFSVKDGFLQNIPSFIIRHPANCSLLIHTKNQSKHSKSQLTIRSLLKKIINFEKLYPSKNNFDIIQYCNSILLN